MGNLARKLNRSKPAYKCTSKPFSQAEYEFVYNSVKNELTADVEKRIKEKITPMLREQIRKEVAAEITNEAYGHFLAITCNILLNDFGKLRSKDTRLKVFYEKLNEYAEQIENPTQKQLDAETEFAKQVEGITIQR